MVEQMAEYWTREGSRVVVRLPVSIFRVVFGGAIMVAGLVLLVAVVGRAMGFGSDDPPFVLNEAVRLAVPGLAFIALGFVVAFHRHRVVIDGAEGRATFIHDLGFFSRRRIVPLSEFTGVKVDRREPVGARPSRRAWYWVCLIGRGRSEEVVALGSPAEAESLREEIAAVVGTGGRVAR
jgi:hypothetical protein